MKNEVIHLARHTALTQRAITGMPPASALPRLPHQPHPSRHEN